VGGHAVETGSGKKAGKIGEDGGEDGGESMPSSTMGGSSASAMMAVSMSPLKSKVGLAGVTQEENATPERVWREL
jgi:hypothetical protein